MTIWSFRRFPRGGAVRQGAAVAAFFLIIEAALGAGLVLLALVGADDSAHRAAAVAVHLVNTFILLGCVTYTAWAATTGRVERLHFQRAGRSGALAYAAVALFM